MADLGDITGLKFNSSTSYVVVDEIGRGGMGIVFLAEKHSEGVVDTVALKTIRTLQPAQLEKLKKEANIATCLRHENIVKTYGLECVPFNELPPEFLAEVDKVRYGSERKENVARIVPGAAMQRSRQILRQQASAARDDRKLYMMVMDYIEGTDLGALHRYHVKRQLIMPCMISAFIISRVARALAYAHQFIVHRDISPENILLNTQGVVKLTDFGIAVTDPEKSKALAGKFTYMAPEQIRQEPLDLRCDLYALGLVLYELLTGIGPHRLPPELTGDALEHRLKMFLSMQIPAPIDVRPDVPKILSDITMKMLASDRNQRYPRAQDTVNHLEQKYLYARGFGPTNNSLQAYWEVFQGDFANPTNDQLKQLGFLKDDEHAFVLKRTVTAKDYTALGLDWISRLRGQ